MFIILTMISLNMFSNIIVNEKIQNKRHIQTPGQSIETAELQWR